MGRATATATLALLIAGCGGEPAGDPTGGAGPAGLGVRVGKATCEQWRAAGVDERATAVAQLEELAAAKPGSEHGTTLPPDRAYEVLDDTCSSEIARGFLLYEIYNRAAAFEPATG